MSDVDNLLAESWLTEVRLGMDATAYRILNAMLNERGYELLTTRATVGNRIVAIIKKTD